MTDVNVQRLEEMSLEELVALEKELAEQRHNLRLAQVAVREAREWKQAMGDMPEELQKRVRLEGAIKSKGK